jgi:Lrp/AsnC family transcriptional regulator for asnA, asnC and gidA
VSSTLKKRREPLTNRALDDIDRRIVSALRADPQATNRDVARAVEISEMTVSNRIDALIEDSLLKVTIQRDVRTMGLECMAHVELHVDGALIDSVAERLAEFEQVFAVTIVIGSPQIVMLVFARDALDLQRFIAEDLADVKGIRQADVALALQTLKADTGIAAL